MKRLFTKMKNWVRENWEEIRFGYCVLVTGLLIAVVIFTSMLIVMTNDLVETVQVRESEIEGYKEVIKQVITEKEIAEGALDSIIQTYEETVPKQQYLDDIAFLEQEIEELRKQLEE